MIEQWRQFRDTVYEISDRGNVRRTNGVPKKPSRSSTGYMIFGCYQHTRRTNILVHRAVAECFIGPCPNGFQVNHIDGNKTNNALENLEYVTGSDNAKHALAMGLSKVPTERSRGATHWTKTSPHLLARGNNNGSRTKPERLVRGEQQHNSKLTESDVLHIRYLWDNGTKTMREIAKFFGITRRNVSYIVNRKSWRHV